MVHRQSDRQEATDRPTVVIFSEIQHGMYKTKSRAVWKNVNNIYMNRLFFTLSSPPNHLPNNSKYRTNKHNLTLLTRKGL